MFKYMSSHEPRKVRLASKSIAVAIAAFGVAACNPTPPTDVGGSENGNEGSAPTISFVPVGESLVTNGTFENGLSGWTEVEVAAKSEDAFEGVGAAKIESGGSISQVVPVEADATYGLIAQVKGSAVVTLMVNGEEGTVEADNTVDYTQVSHLVETGEGVELEVSIDSAELARVDNVELFKVDGGTSPTVLGGDITVPESEDESSDLSDDESEGGTPGDSDDGATEGSDDDDLTATPLDNSEDTPILRKAAFNFDLWEFEGSNPFNPNGGTFVFDALEEQEQTPNGNGWRHEMKIAESERVPCNQQFERFFANITVDLSLGTETIVAQHHPEGDGALVALYIRDSSEPPESERPDAPAEAVVDNGIPRDGIFDVYVTLRNPDGGKNIHFVLGTVKSGDNFNYELINNRGDFSITGLGESTSVKVANSAECYAKFGSYQQCRDPETLDRVKQDDCEEFYADQGLTRSKVTFEDVTYERTVD